MLVLTRKLQEKICIGDDVTVTVLKMKGKTVRLGIEAPGKVAVVRGELRHNDTREVPPCEATASGQDSSTMTAQPRHCGGSARPTSQQTATWNAGRHVLAGRSMAGTPARCDSSDSSDSGRPFARLTDDQRVSRDGNAPLRSIVKARTAVS